MLNQVGIGLLLIAFAACDPTSAIFSPGADAAVADLAIADASPVEMPPPAPDFAVADLACWEPHLCNDGPMCCDPQCAGAVDYGCPPDPCSTPKYYCWYFEYRCDCGDDHKWIYTDLQYPPDMSFPADFSFPPDVDGN